MNAKKTVQKINEKVVDIAEDFVEKHTSKKHRAIYWVFLAFSIVGFLASFIISVEEIVLLKNPAAQLTCNFNPVFNCASVMRTWQGSLLGFPNPFIGIAGFAALLAISVTLLTGFRPPRWFKIVMLGGITLVTIFAYWLFFQSVFSIQVLCMWCLMVTTSMTILFDAVVRWNLREKTLCLPKNIDRKVQFLLDKDVDKVCIATWILAGVLLVIFKFNLLGL